MKLPIWVHQVQTSYMQAGVGPSDVGLPFNAVLGKVADGLNFMSTWDRHPAAISGLEAVVARERNHQTESGRGYIPWMVPRGAQPGKDQLEYATDEASLASDIAAAGAGTGERPIIILDLEPFYHGGATPQFWRNDLLSSVGEKAVIRRWVDTFHERLPGGEIWLAVDAREPHLQNVQFNVWLDAMEDNGMKSRVMPMVYWTDFGITPRTAIERALALLGGVYAIRSSSISMIFPGNAAPRGPEGLVEAIQYAKDKGTLTPSIWQRSNLSKENAQAIENMVDPWFGESTDVEEVIEESAVEGITEEEMLKRFELAWRRGFNAHMDASIEMIESTVVAIGGTIPANSRVRDAVIDLLP